MKHSILFTIFKVVGIALILISFSVLVWANSLVNRIKRIKDKIDNLEKTRKKKKVVECIFINYEPIVKGIVEPERVIKYEDVFG